MFLKICCLKMSADFRGEKPAKNIEMLVAFRGFLLVLQPKRRLADSDSEVFRSIL